MEVLFHDAVLLAVNKPSGLLTHRGWANDRDTALVRARSIAGKYVHPVHRLDRATSGVLVFALDPETANAMSQTFATDAFEKRYLALVRGITEETIEIDHPLAKEPGAEAKPARTSVRRLGCFERYSLVMAAPHTGRTHQIRRHLKHVSHPVIGDTRYGHGEHNRLFRTRHGLHRLALHAARVSFVHPQSGARITLSASLPDDLALPLAAIGLFDDARTAIERDV